MAIWEDFDTEDAMPIAAVLGFPEKLTHIDTRAGMPLYRADQR
jgi:hypothetical protein